MILNARSLKALKHVHPDLIAVIMRAAEKTKHEFIITEGLRTLERQKELFKKGLSKTMNSRHLTGHAVDFAPLIDGELTWKTQAFNPVIDIIDLVATELKIPVEFGARWKTFRDYPHVQLARSKYP